MARTFCVIFGLAAYVVFFVTFLYLVGFVGNFPGMPTSVERGVAVGWGTAGLIDLVLIAAFGVQHSVMARPGFKAMWTRVVAEPVERSVYVLAASLMLILMMALWHPLGLVTWTIRNPVFAGAAWAVFAAGWSIVLLSTFLINHFELFGLAQVARNWMSRSPGTPQLRRPLFYKFVRHPLYSGFLLAFWATPRMTAGHLLLAAGMTAYILIAIRYEERDLIAVFGSDYEQYRKDVGKIVPRFGRAM